jgi:hypothetical protein
MARNKPLDEEKALLFLKEQGYIVRKPTVYFKRTFEVDEEIYREFKEVQKSLRLKVKEAFNLALEDWVKKHRSD